jgi:hypothetical protein
VPSCEFSINDVAQLEGDSGTTAFTFTITLSNCSTRAQMHIEVNDGTAERGQDYSTQGSGELIFNPGETTKTYTVQVRGDTLCEGDETFFVVLSNPQGATIADGSGTGTIQDDDCPAP